MTFLRDQTYKDEALANNSLPMYATANSLEELSNGVTFNYLASVLRIPVRFNSPTKIRRVIVTTLNNEALSGTYDMLTTEQGVLTGELEEFASTNNVIYDFTSEGTQFGANTVKNFHITIPPGSYQNGFAMRIYDEAGNYMINTIFADEPKEINAGIVYELNETVFYPTATSFVISTPQDLQRFSTFNGPEYVLVDAIVINDIDMTGYEYNSDSFTYCGRLDGMGHSIIGLTTPLFNNLRGPVKNLNLTVNHRQYTLGDYSSLDNNPYGTGLLARYINQREDTWTEEELPYVFVVENVTVNGKLTVDMTVSEDNNYNIGGIAGASNNVPLISCVNNATIEVINVANAKNLRVGGCVGVMQTGANANLTDCKNEGSITLTSVNLTEDLYVGGVSGLSTQPIEANQCSNGGKITINAGSSANLFVGGIIGSSTSSNLTINTVEQRAYAGITVSQGYTTSSAYYVGGIVGSNSFDITNAKNSAPITVAGTTTSGNVAVGGISGRCQGALSEASNYGDVAVTSNMNATTPNGIYVGGVVGNANNENTSLSGTIYNEGNVSCSGQSTVNLMLGGLVGDFSNGTSSISGQINKGNVTCNATIAGDTYVGGCFGRSCRTMSVVNEGEVNVTTTNLASYLYTGGVAGYLNGEITVDGCINRGPVNIDGTGATYKFLGGVFGSKSESATQVLNCVNESTGTLTISGETSTAYFMMMGGILGGCPGGSAVISGCKNYAAITNNYTGGSSYASRPVSIGGILGRVTNSKLASLTLCENHGALTNNCPVTNSDSNIIMGGIIGYIHQGFADNTFTKCTNYGSVTNNADCSANVGLDTQVEMVGIILGGVAGYSQAGTQIRDCHNQGNVTNNGDASQSSISIAGILGIGTDANHYLRACTNGVQGVTSKGVIINTGYSSAPSGPDSCVGGMVARAIRWFNFKDQPNTNYGPVSDSSPTTWPVVGGILAYGKAHGHYLENSVNYGPLSLSGDIYKGRIGGIVGYIQGGNITMADAINYGDITVHDSEIDYQLYVGGIIGVTDNTTARTHANLRNEGKITIKSGITATSNATVYNYVGGICAYSKGKTFSNCINTGDIDMRPSSTQLPLKTRVGGILGYANTNPTGSKCFADIGFWGSKENCGVGGIAGYLNVSTYSELTFKGNINSNGTSGTNYTGGIIGNTLESSSSSSTKTFTNCTFSGTTRGSNGGVAVAGLFCNTQEADLIVNYVFDGCKVGSGSIHKAGSGGTANATTITSDSQLIGDYLLGGRGALSCTVTNCTVVDPATITL